MIKIICVGSLKENYLKDAEQEYQKRLQKYTSLKIIEVPEEGYKDPLSALKKEQESILKHISEKDYVITLEIEGKNLDSIEFARTLDQLFINNSNLIFVIGGSFGLGDEIKERANQKISFSRMTFPHQLFRILLLEQIYRGYKIINHESYHK